VGTELRLGGETGTRVPDIGMALTMALFSTDSDKNCILRRPVNMLC
jgi:hypothetical protein